MQIEHWNIGEDVRRELDAHYKTKYALSLTRSDPMEIAHALTFDGLADSITIEDLTRFLSTLDRLFLQGNGFKGIGLEIGSGPGTFVATFARLPNVTRIYGVEACEAIVQELMTPVVSHIAHEHTQKVVGTVADFNRLELPDSSVDFIFDFFSLHHSSNPEVTIAELFRVLKPGGVMVCVDKARANALSNETLDVLLDVEYSKDAKIAMGLPPDVFHTRRMNGEHEYRLSDWNTYFTDVGFEKLEHYNVAKIGGIFPVKVIKYILANLPLRLQTYVSKFISKKVTNSLESSNRIFTNLFPNYPREFSLMIARKK